MTKLYWAPRTRSLRALWVLEEAGVPYERVRLDLSAGEHKSADYCAINPMAKVPALTDGPVAIAESGAICAYVAEAHPEAGLAPPVGDPARVTCDGCFSRRAVSSRPFWSSPTMSRFDEDRWRTRKDFSPLNLAIVRPIDFNILKKDKSKLSLKRNRLKASVNPISGRRCSLVNDSAFCREVEALCGQGALRLLKPGCFPISRAEAPEA
jgi:Glutathione S-transferase, N-terminal domain